MIRHLRMVIVLLLTFILSFKAGAQNQLVTNGTATAPVNFTSAGCRYNWTNSNPAIGLPASGMGNIASFTAVNTGTAPITATITATPVQAGYAYIPNAVDNTVSAIDLSTKTLKAKISVGETPVSEAISEDGSKVYIVNSGSYSLSVINTATNTVTATIPLVNFNTGAGYVLTDLTYGPIAGHPEGVAVSPDGKHVYVANRGIAYSIDTKDNNNNVTGHVNVYVIYVIDTTTGDVSMISFGKDASSVRVSRDGTLLYVSDFSNTISVIDLIHTQSARPILISGITAGNDNATLQGAGVATIKATIVEPPTNFFSGTPSPYIMVLTPDGSEMYVTNTNGFTVSAINTATNTIISTINVGQFPEGICMSADGSKIYVACIGSNLVDVISTATNTIIKTYFSLNAPTAVSLSPDGKLLYVNNAQTSDIAIIDVSSSVNSAIDDINLGGTAYSNGGQVGNFITPGSCSGSPVTFTITVNPINTADATLTTITTTPETTLTSTTGPGYGNYTAAVANAISSLQVTPTAQDAMATITVNGQATASGVPSQSIPLTVGANTITIVVTAQDGATIKNYILTVTRAASPVATLASLTLSAGTLSPAFAPSTINYSAIVPNTVSSVKLTPAVSETGATVNVNGIAVASGSASPAITLAVGPNVINTIVTAADGVTTKTYTVTVTRISNNAKLLTIKPNPKTTLTGVSGPGFGNYTTDVPFSESSLTLTSTAADATATIKVNGTGVASGAASQAIPLNVGDNVITIIVTAQDGATTKTYYITATRAASPIATLSGLALSAGTLSPGFATATTGYTAIVPNAASSIKITPGVTDANATIKVNGVTVASGAPSGSFPLAVGTNTITTVVTAQDGTSTETYTVTVTRAAAGLSTEAKLLTIKPNPKTTLTGVAGPGFGNYTTAVPNSESSIILTATAADANATIKVNGATVASGAASQSIPLNVGDNVITIIVTAQDGATTKTYYVTATRAPSPIATLSNLALSAGTLSPVFATATAGYTAIVPNAISSIKITPTVTEANATIKVNGVTVASGAASPAIPLAVGTNTITTVVTAQDGATTKTYTLTVTRAAAGLSTEARLLTIKPNPKTTLTAVAGPGFGNYTTAVPNSESSVTLTSTAIDATATIKVNGTPVASGAASQPLPLTVGTNLITIIVTAQDGATTKTYYITVTKAPSPIATLSNLALSAGTLSPGFTPATTAYTAVVPNATSFIKITPAVTEAHATVKVNGATVASGAASANIPLAVGTNVINAVVTAQDGITTKTYAVTVTRAAAGLSTEARLLTIKPNPKTTLTVVTGPGFGNYTTAVPNSESSVTLTSTAIDATATINVNGITAASGAASQSIPLKVGDNVITIIVTAQDGATTKTYYITATRAAGSMVAQYTDDQAGNLKTDGIVVHQGVSPNGDGDNDVLTIDGIAAYPDNSLQIMNRSGALVYEAKGYDNTTKVFDGHSSSNGKLQQAGTYFYSLDYKDGAETKHKTGFIVLKY